MEDKSDVPLHYSCGYYSHIHIILRQRWDGQFRGPWDVWSLFSAFGVECYFMLWYLLCLILFHFYMHETIGFVFYSIQWFSRREIGKFTTRKRPWLGIFPRNGGVWIRSLTCMLDRSRSYSITEQLRPDHLVTKPLDDRAWSMTGLLDGNSIL